MAIYRIYEWSNKNGDESNTYYVSDKETADKKVADLLDYYTRQGYADSQYEVICESYTVDKMMEEDSDLVDMELEADKPQFIDTAILDMVRG
jgi:hypothetical protein